MKSNTCEIKCSNKQLSIEVDSETHKLTLYKNNFEIGGAYFAYNSPDSVALLSAFSPELSERSVQAICEAVSDYVAVNSGGKLFTIIPEAHTEAFDSMDEYRSENIDRLMILAPDERVAIDVNPPMNGLKIVTDNKEIQTHRDAILKIMTAKLDQEKYSSECNAYWADDITLEKLSALIDASSMCFMLTKNEEVVGFVRYLENSRVGYIADMVIDLNHQKKGLGTYLMQTMFSQCIANKAEECLLIRARQNKEGIEHGPGDKAAPKLYGKFKFIDSNDINHTLNAGKLYFRYIKKIPAKILTNNPDSKNLSEESKISFK